MNHYREIQSLLCQYGSTIDRGELEACAELFTYGQWCFTDRTVRYELVGDMSAQLNHSPF